MLGGFQCTKTIQEVSAKLRAQYTLQSAVTLERQLAGNITLAVTYANSHGAHMFRSQDINAPLPGTYNPNVQGSGVFPLGAPGPLDLMESSGVYNQNQLIANINAKVNAGFSLFGFYVLNHAMSNTDGIGTFPANPYNFMGEYGPAATDVRNRMSVGGSVTFRWNVRVSPFVTVQSGAPFDITAGNDLYGTTLFNGRPGILADANKTGLIATRYGQLDPNPVPSEPLLSRNFGRGPGPISLNLRIGKTIGFGAEPAGPKTDARPGGGGGRGGGGGGERGGGGLAPAAGSGGRRGIILGGA